eukprot:SAG22_NODE_306_length_12671_cov_14.743239_7_plen_364_part_00
MLLRKLPGHPSRRLQSFGQVGCAHAADSAGRCQIPHRRSVADHLDVGGVGGGGGGGVNSAVVTAACEAAAELAGGLRGGFDAGWASGLLPALFGLAGQTRAALALAADAARFRVACHCPHPAVLGVAARVAMGPRRRARGAAAASGQPPPGTVGARVAAVEFLLLALQGWTDEQVAPGLRWLPAAVSGTLAEPAPQLRAAGCALFAELVAAAAAAAVEEEPVVAERVAPAPAARAAMAATAGSKAAWARWEVASVGLGVLRSSLPAAKYAKIVRALRRELPPAAAALVDADGVLQTTPSSPAPPVPPKAGSVQSNLSCVAAAPLGGHGASGAAAAAAAGDGDAARGRVGSGDGPLGCCGGGRR